VELANYDAVRRLDDGAIRALLRDGAPVERVWAGWEIGMRLGRGHPEIVGHIANEPTPGVRRALLVVLAGHGEVDVVVALACHDPAVEVRAAAMALIVRFAAQGAMDARVVLDAYERDAGVRVATLAAVPRDAPADLTALVHRALATGTADEQLEAFEAAWRIATPEARDAALAWLSTTTRDDAWLRLAHQDPKEVVAGLLRGPPSLRKRALRTTAFRIADLAPLAMVTDGGALRAIRDRSDFDNTPAAVLARAIVLGSAVGFLEAFAARPDDDRLSRDLADRLLAYCRDRLAEIERGRYLPDEQPHFRWPARLHYGRVLARLGDR